jgi:phage I-like protein
VDATHDVDLVPLAQRAQRVEALERELVALRTEREATERRALLDSAQRAGKITPAQRSASDAGKGFLATLSLPQLKAYLAEAVPVVALGAQHTPPTPDASASTDRPGAALVSLTEAEEKVIKLAGITREQYLRTKSKTSTIPVAERPARG